MRFVAKFAALFAATLSLCSMAQAEPLISAFIGTQTATSKTAFFVLDFNDPGPNPETYAFGWHYEGTKTGADFAGALAASLTGANGFVEGRYSSGFVHTFGYNGRQKSSLTEEFGYFSYWLGFDGSDWTGAQFGDQTTTLSDTPVFTFNTFTQRDELSGAKWHGWRWVNDYRTDIATAPRTPQQVAAVVPEAGTPELFAAGLAGMTLLVRRRVRRATVA